MEYDFAILVNDHQIKCNKKFVESNFFELYQSAGPDKQIKIQIEGGNNFLDVTKNIFQGNDFEITNDNFGYLEELSKILKNANLLTKLNLFYYKRECDDNQIDQHPSIQFLTELSSLIHKISNSNAEEISSQIKKKLIPMTDEEDKINTKNQTSKTDENDQSEKDDYDNSENEDESEEENEEDKVISFKKIGNKALNKLFYFEIVNTLATGFNSNQQFIENKRKVQFIIQIIQELDSENRSRSSEDKVFLNSFINYIIGKYTKIKNQRSSITNYKQETLYLIHYLLSNELMQLSQIHQNNDPIDLYFLEFFEESEINKFFRNNDKIVEFLENQIDEPKAKSKNKTNSKKNRQGNENENKDALYIDFLSKNIKNGLISDDETINIFLNDDINQFQKSFNDDSIRSFVFPNEISQISCLSALTDCSLFELSAFFGSQKIFNYLNDKKISKEIEEPRNLSSFVLIGQNSQIINTYLNGIDSTNRDLIFEILSFCNDHHFNNTYEMILNTIDNCPKPTTQQIDQYMKKCISRSYFDFVPYLLKEGATANVLLNLFCKSGNEVGIVYMLQFSYINVNSVFDNKTPLEYCLESKNASGSILLLKNDFINVQLIDNKSKIGENVLHISCRLGLSRVVSYLIRKHLYDVNVQTKDGICPIHFACLSGDYETVAAVIRGKKVHIRTKVKAGQYMKRTALHFACCSGNASIITLLLDSDARLGLDDVDCKERTPIICAIKDNHVDCVRVLLEQEDIDINQEYKGNNLLQYACLKNHNEVFDVILNAIIFDANQPCADGRVILTVAIENHNDHIVKSILDKFENEVNVNIDTSDGKTPLVIACELGLVNIVKLLLNHDTIDADKPASSDGTTPFMAAAKSGNIELLNLLRQNGDEIDIYAKNKVGMTAIYMAFFAEQIEAVKFLLPLFRDKLSDTTANGETLLQIACKRGNIELSKLLIDQPGVDINVRDNNGMTPYLSAVQEGKLELVKALINNNDCDINECANDGRNAFLIAVESQNIELVKFFIQLYIDNNKSKTKSKSKNKKQKQTKSNSFVDINAKTKEDMSALFITLKLKNKEILQELINCPFIDINETSRDRTFLCKLVKKIASPSYRLNADIVFNYNEILDLVLARDDVEVNKPSSKYFDQTCLHIACKSSKNDIPLVKKMLAIKGIDINARSKEGTPLFLLIKYQNAYFVPNDHSNRFNLLNINFPPHNLFDNNNNNNNLIPNEEEDDKSSNDEHEEAENRNNNNNVGIDMLDQLCWRDFLDNPKLDLNAGGDPVGGYGDLLSEEIYERSKKEKTDKENYLSPLEYAIKKKYTVIAEALISKKGIDVNSNYNLMQRTPLHLAILDSDVKLINKLMENDQIKVNIQDKTGATPLLLALESNNPRLTNVILKMLERKDVKKGINLSKEKDMVTPFLVAVTNSSSEIFNSFLQIKNIDLESKDKKGRTALYLLVKSLNKCQIDNIVERVVMLHQKCPSLLNIANDSGKTPLFRAIHTVENESKKSIDIISYFLDQDDIDLSLPEDLHVEKKKNSNKVNEKYTSLLHLACSKSIAVIVNKLIPLTRNYYKNKEREENIFAQKNDSGNTILNVACVRNDIKTIDVIINYIKNPVNEINYDDPNEFDINTESSNGLTPLHSICKMAQSELSILVLNSILSFEKLNINARSSSELKTALHYASKSNNKEAVEILINIDSIDPNICDNDGCTPLLIAALENESGIVKRLLKNEKVDVNSPLPLIDKTPLFVACEKLNVKIVTHLLNDQRTDVNCHISPSGKTPLMYTIETYKVDLFHLILNNEKIDLNAVDNEGLTVLHYACQIGKLDFIKEIVSRKKSNLASYLNAQTKSGLTPLHYVCMSNNKEAIFYLLGMNQNEKMIDINIADQNGMKPFDYYLSNQGGFDSEISDAFAREANNNEIQANVNVFNICQNGQYDKIKYIISDSLYDFNSKDNNEKMTILHILCQNQKVELVKEVLQRIDEYNIDINSVDKNGMTPLHHAVIVGFDQKIVKLLLDTNKCDINAKDNDGRTALHYACEKGKTVIIEELLKKVKSIDLNAKDNHGSTPLHESAKSLRFDVNILKMLLNSKCVSKINPNMTDDDGNTPLHLACLKENDMFVSSLIELSPVDIDANVVNKKHQTPLFIVCMKGDFLIFTTLFSSKLKNQIDINLTSPIYIAAFKGNFFLVEKLLEMPQIDLNSNKKDTYFNYSSENESSNNENYEDDYESDFSGLNLLHILMSYSEPLDLIKKLIEMNQFDINEPTADYIEDKMNGTPLIIALKNNQLKNINVLLDYYGAQLDLRIYDSKGMAAVHHCFQLTKSGDSILKELIKIDNSIINMETKNDERQTPLLIAFEKGNIDNAISLLQEPTINVFCYNKLYNTPIHFAASEKRQDVINFVLMKIKSAMNEPDSNEQKILEFVNYQNKNGETALLIGCKNSNISAVQVLIDTFKDDLDFTKCDENKTTPFIAALMSRNDELIHLLLLNDNCISTIDLSIPLDENNNYIAHLMAKNSNLENFILLIEQTSGYSSNINFNIFTAKNNQDESLITIAAEKQNVKLFDYICDTQNPDLNFLINGNTPLVFMAAKQYNAEIFESIIKHGSFDLNSKFEGKTVLHYACESKIDSNSKVKLLIHQNNIDVNCVTSRGSMTPLHLAVKNKKVDVVETLLSLDSKIDIEKKSGNKRTASDMSRNRAIKKLFFDYDIRNKKNES